MEHTHFRVSYIESLIEKSFGEEFENIASFIMHLIDPLFLGTRNSKDGGIDGIKVIGKGRAIYSAYGPKDTTDWNKAKYKINDDAQKAKKFLERNKLPLRKWCILLNRNLNGDEFELIWKVCKDNCFNKNQVEILTPKRLIAKVEEHDVSIATARFLGLVGYREIPFDDLRPHAIAKKAFQLLTEIKNENKESKIEVLNNILHGIIRQVELFQMEDKQIKFKGRLQTLITHRTRISDDFIRSYIYSDGLFKEQHKDGSELHRHSVSLNDNNQIIITVRNLHILYIIVKRLIKNVENYNIEHTLTDLHRGLNHFRASQKIIN